MQFPPVHFEEDTYIIRMAYHFLLDILKQSEYDEKRYLLYIQDSLRKNLIDSLVHLKKFLFLHQVVS